MLLMYADSDDEAENQDDSIDHTISSSKKSVSFAADEVLINNTQGKLLLHALDSTDSLNDRVASLASE